MKDLHLARTIWKCFQPMISGPEPLAVAKRGRPRAKVRRVFLGICYLLWTGCPWRALPRQFGSRATVHRYFKKWADSGLFGKLWRLVLIFLDNKGHLASKTQIVDGSQVMVQYLPKTVAFVSSKYRPKRTIKFSLLIDSQGIPLSTILGKANEHDSNLLEGTLTNSVINGLKWQENCLLGDKGYVGARQEMTALLSGFSSVFPPKKNQVKRLTKRKMDKLKNNRWKVERSISWIKNFRRLKICYEKSLESYQAYLDLACLSISFKKAFL